MTIWEWLKNIDQHLFSFIHSDASTVHIDWLMRALRYAWTWAPLYAFIFYWIIRYYRRSAIMFIMMSLVCFAITDFTSSSILKPFFARLRPCYEPGLQTIIRHVVDCGGKNSMPSSHAANHFGLAAFWYFTIYRLSGKKWSWLWLWAAAIGYAQVYVGKHYPLDIVVGGLFGLLTGGGLSWLFSQWVSKAGTKDKIVLRNTT